MSQQSDDGRSSAASAQNSAAQDMPASSSFLRDVPLPLEEPMPAHVGGYRILRVLGRGGMGVVYEAEQEATRRSVALKLVHPHLATHRYRRRFAEEIRTLGRFEHEGIARIFDAGAAPDDTGAMRLYFAMERVVGLRLDEHARTQRLAPSAVASLIAEVCDAVQHAHQKGVIHCDLKPANIIVGIDGRPKVLDFGVARLLEDEVSLATVTHASEPLGMVGTLGYASPEQANGDRNRLDVLTDVYGLGAVLYALLAGRSPHDVASCSFMQAVDRVRSIAPRRLRDVVAACPVDLDTIAAKAMAAVPRERYQSAAALAADLRRFVEGRPILARPVGWPEAVRKWVLRRRALSAALAATTIVLAGLAAVLVATTIELQSTARRVITERRHHDESRSGLQRSSLPVNARFRQSVNLLEHLADDEAPEYPGRVLRAFGAAGASDTLAGRAGGRLVAVDPNGNLIDTLDTPRVIPPWARPRFDAARRFVEVEGAAQETLTLCGLCVAIDAPQSARLLLRGMILPNDQLHCSVLETDSVDNVIHSRGRLGSACRQLWSHGDIQDIAWDASRRLVWCVANGEELAWCSPELAHWDSARCPDGGVEPLLLVALDEASLDGVLPPLAGDARHRPVAPRWSFTTRPPHSVRGGPGAEPIGPARESILQVQAFEPYPNADGRGLGRLYVAFRRRSQPLDPVAWVDLDEEGRPIGDFHLAPLQQPVFDEESAALVAQFVPSEEIVALDLGAIANAWPIAERLVAEAGDDVEARRRAAAMGQANDALRRAIDGCIEARRTNWRWLSASATEELSRDEVLERLGGGCNDDERVAATRAKQRLEQAIALHAERCPSHGDGTCIYDRYMATGVALGAAASEDWEACVEAATRARGIRRSDRPEDAYDALNQALCAIAYAALGARESASAALAEAERLTDVTRSLKPDGSAFRLVPLAMERARAVVAGE